MKNVILGLIGVAALAVSTVSMAGGPARADVNYNSNPAGFYVGGNIGYGETDLDSSIKDDLDTSSFVWGADVGYQFNRYFALEGGYIQLPRVKVKGIDVKMTPSVVYLAVKGIYPVSSKFDIFGKIGAGRTNERIHVAGESFDVDNHELVPLMGVGADINVTPHFAITTQALATFETSGFPTTYIGTVGLAYKF